MIPRRLSRSYLFAPGDNPDLLEKVFLAGADAIVIDLEDGVAPPRKTDARALTAAALAGRRGAGPVTYVRINAVSTPFWRDDLEAVVRSGVAGLRIGKVESARDVISVASEVSRLEAERGLPIGAVTLVPTIESAIGVIVAAAIARAPRVEALAFGAADFLKDINGESEEDEGSTLVVRSMLVLASRAAGLGAPIASVHTDVRNLDSLRSTTEAARRLGFFGRSAVHPAQIRVINEVFTPSQAQVSAAQTVVDAFDRAAASGLSVAQTPDGQFVDPPIADRARAILSLAERLEVRAV